MKSQSLFHDHAFALATVLLGLVENCLRPEERRGAWDAFYEAAMASFQHYEATVDRMRRRVRPSTN